MKITILFYISELFFSYLKKFYFSATSNNFGFLEKISQKRILPVKNKKLSITSEFFIFELV